MYRDPYGAYDTADERAEREAREDEYAAGAWAERDDDVSYGEALAILRDERATTTTREDA